MPNLKLVVGKTYLSREGKRVRIELFYPVKSALNVQYPFQGDNGRWYTELGHWHIWEDGPSDLVRLAPPLKRKPAKKAKKKGRK